MIDFYPIILYSSENNGSIWIDIKSQTTHDGTLYLRLLIAGRSGGWDALKLKSPFYDGTEEGFTQRDFNVKVPKLAFEKMLSEIHSSKLAEAKFPKELNLNHIFESFEGTKFGIKISRVKESDDCAFQLVLDFKGFASIFQIRTTAKNLWEFVAKAEEKIQYINRTE